MDNKGINGSGLAHLWGKIKAEIAAQVSTGVQKELKDYAKSEDIPTTEETVNAVLEALPTWQGGEY